MAKAWVTVRLDITQGVDYEDVISNMDYSFTHPYIQDTEIITASWDDEAESWPDNPPEANAIL